MIAIGRYNTLTVVKTVDFGIYLEGGEYGEILMPQRYVPPGCKVDDILEVFVYRDSEDRIIATTETPYAVVGEFAFLKVIDVTPVGAFLDWGLLKDLMVPFREQKGKKMEKGKSYIVRVYLDEKTQRIAASAKLGKFLDKEPAGYKIGQTVDVMICAENELGYQCIVDNAHWGQLYRNEIFESLNIGHKKSGFIKKLRDDGKIDIMLQEEGYDKISDISHKILSMIKDSGGFIAVTDESDPGTIYKLFGVSKKNYKKAVGALYKDKLIELKNDGIKLALKGNTN